MTDAHWTTHYWTFSEPLPVYISKLLPLSLALRFFDFKCHGVMPPASHGEGELQALPTARLLLWLLKYRVLLAS
jgi:hypothetical protein